MAMESAKRKEHPPMSNLPEGARRFQEALENGDTPAVKAMKAAAARTRAVRIEMRKAADDRARDRRTLTEIRELEALGEVEMNPETGEIIRLYEPPAED